MGATKGAGAAGATPLPDAPDLTVASRSRESARVGGAPKMSCSDCISSTTSSSARKAASSAAVGSEPSFNSEAGAMSAASLV